MKIYVRLEISNPNSRNFSPLHRYQPINGNKNINNPKYKLKCNQFGLIEPPVIRDNRLLGPNFKEQNSNYDEIINSNRIFRTIFRLIGTKKNKD